MASGSLLVSWRLLFVLLAVAQAFTLSSTLDPTTWPHDRQYELAYSAWQRNPSDVALANRLALERERILEARASRKRLWIAIAAANAAGLGVVGWILRRRSHKPS
jgi:hypothetical protein